jgi:hypothetical protein
MLDMRGGFLYQHRPDLMPHGMLTNEEVSLWAVYHERRNREDSGAQGPGRRG